MATNWIDVADSAVKIGLGAAIAGIVAIIIPMITFAKETYSDRRARRLKLLEESVITFNEYCTGEMTFTAALTDGIIYRHRKKNDSFVHKRYTNARDKMDEVGAKFHKAVAYMELLGHHELASQVRTIYRLHDTAQDKLREAPSPESAQEIYDRLKDDTRELKTTIHKEFGRIYALEPEIRKMLLLDGPIV